VIAAVAGQPVGVGKAMAAYRVWLYGQGAVLGSKAFVNGVFAANRERFGAKRKDGARRLRYLEDASLFALRDLRIKPVG
jgi:hypothetical protein